RRRPAAGKQGARRQLVSRIEEHRPADPGRAGLPQLHRQALLHSIRIDDAGAADRRPAGGEQIPLWLVLCLAQLPPPALPERTGAGSPARTGRHRHRVPAESARGLYQAGDRPARRHHR
ncbi:hypothetical protein LTR94_034996, partial [Friedmanniomyces endolithicus]